MPNLKRYLEFTPVGLVATWETPPGYPPGITRKILASDINEVVKTGSRTQLLRFEPSVFTTEPFVHEHWEEVLLIQGDLAIGSNDQGRGGRSIEPMSYACRPPGAAHGPFSSKYGCLLLELHYFAPA